MSVSLMMCKTYVYNLYTQLFAEKNLYFFSNDKLYI
jgi:hypothetical protein